MELQALEQRGTAHLQRMDVDGVDHFEWRRRPSTEGRPDYSSRVSTGKGLGLDKKASKTQYTYPIRESNINDNRANSESIEMAPEQ